MFIHTNDFIHHCTQWQKKSFVRMLLSICASVCVCVSTEHFCCYGFVRMRLNSFVLVYAHPKQAHIIIIIRTADIDGKPVRDRRGIYTQTDNLLT